MGRNRKRFGNKKADAFLEGFKLEGLESERCRLAQGSKFSFAYFDSSQQAGRDFQDLEKEDLCDLLHKLADFAKETLEYWMNRRMGSTRVLSIYGEFPENSDFTFPKHVPIDVLWGRFRLEKAVRLVGFVVPNHLDGKVHGPTGRSFCKNTFYIVFLDWDHRFYKGESK